MLKPIGQVMISNLASILRSNTCNEEDLLSSIRNGNWRVESFNIAKTKILNDRKIKPIEEINWPDFVTNLQFIIAFLEACFVAKNKWGFPHDSIEYKELNFLVGSVFDSLRESLRNQK